MADDVGTESVVVADDRSRRLYRTLAWVGIVAGVVFIVGAVFFSGYALGRGSGGYHGWHNAHRGAGGCPMMGGDMGPGRMGGMGQGSPGSNPAGPNPAGPPRP